MKLVPLGSVAEVIAGQSPEGIYYNSRGEGMPFYQGKKEFGDKFLGAPTTWTTKTTKLARSKDILMSVRAPVGPINFATQEICIGRGLAAIRASESLDEDFLYYFLLHKQPEISGNTGAVFDSINKDQIASIPIPLPSLDKQLEIVKKLDSAFAEIDLLEWNILKRKEQFELLLRSSLSVPYKSSAKPVIKAMQLGEIADFQGGSQPAKSNFVFKERKGYVRFIQIRDFGSDKNLTYIPISPKNRLCVESDILIGRYGASVGKILTGLKGAYNVALMKVIPKSEIVDRDYLYFYLLSELFQQNLLNVSDRSAQNGFSKEDINTFLVNLPSVPEQKRIVESLSSVRNDILEANSRNLKAKSECASLRQSFLSSSFTQVEAVA